MKLIFSLCICFFSFLYKKEYPLSGRCEPNDNSICGTGRDGTIFMGRYVEF